MAQGLLWGFRCTARLRPAKRSVAAGLLLGGLLLGGLLVCAALGCSAPPAEEVTPAESGVEVTGEPLQFAAGDWPQWRGPGIDGIVHDDSLPTTWDAQTHVAWTAEIPGRGHGSPVIVGDVVYLATALEQAEKQCVLAFDAATGQQLWMTEVHQGGFTPTPEMHPKSTQANGTVACDGERVYVAFLNRGKVVATALDLDGQEVWQTTLGSFQSKFGYAPSPILYRSVVIFPADHGGGGYLAALDRQSGELSWRAARPRKSSYSSAYVGEIAGQDQLVICGCDQVASYDPRDGELLWEVAATTVGTCGTVVSDGDVVYASGGFPGRETVAITGDGSAEKLWSQRVKLYEPSLLVHEGLLFGVDDDGIARCWAADSGEELWKTRLEGKFSASPILADGLVYVPNLQGKTFIFRATGSGFEPIAENKLGTDNYASLAVSNGALYIRAGYGEGSERIEKLHRIEQTAGR